MYSIHSFHETDLGPYSKVIRNSYKVSPLNWTVTFPVKGNIELIKITFVRFDFTYKKSE